MGVQTRVLTMKDDMHEITVREIARLALTKMFDTIGDELDLSDGELFKIRDFLEKKLND